MTGLYRSSMDVSPSREVIIINCCNYEKQTINLTPLVLLNICMLCVITETVCAVFSLEEKTEYEKSYYFG